MKWLRNFLLFLLTFWMIPGLKAQHQIPGEFCISNDELKLYNLVNTYRKQNKLPEISLSKSLCYVAKLHVNDLQNNHPDTMDCNLHSWSDKGGWTECCYGREKFNHTCMTSKPRELTNYPGLGYEIAFWENMDAQPVNVIDLWKSSASSNELMLSKGVWKGFAWKSVGVGIFKGYAVVWFGKEEDVESGVKICNSDGTIGLVETEMKKTEAEVENTPVKKQESKTEVSKTGEVRFYLIAASVKVESQAKAEIERFRKKGFKNPKIIGSGNNFRISLGDYATREEALAVKKRLGDKYKEVWIYKN